MAPHEFQTALLTGRQYNKQCILHILFDTTIENKGEREERGSARSTSRLTKLLMGMWQFIRAKFRNSY